MHATFSSPPPIQFSPNHLFHGQPLQAMSMQSMRAPITTSSPVGWPGGFVPNAGVNGNSAVQGLVSHGSMSNIHSVFQHQQPHGQSMLGPHGSMGSLSSMVPPSVSMPVPFHQHHPTMSALPAKNTVEMTRDMLIQVLDRFSVLLEEWFEFRSPSASGGGSNYPHNIRLVVHGGACMLLHPQLYTLSEQQASVFATRGDPENMNMGQRRTTTRDVDFIARGFLAEYGRVWTRGSVPVGRGGEKGRGMDAKERLRACIHETAVSFGLGEDWMNADADVALPMAYDPTNTPYDPIYTAAVQPNNVDLHTIYTSPNMRLTLISVTPFWAVSLKLVRYTKWDRVDVCLLLRNGTLLSGTQWTPEMLQSWLEMNCWAMGYANYDERKKEEMNQRIKHAIWALQEWTKFVGGGSADMYTNSNGAPTWDSREGTRKQPERQWSAHEAMGGGAPGSVVGGEQASQMGWFSSFGSDGIINGPSTRPQGHGQVSVADWGSSNISKRKKSPSRRRRSRSQSRGERFIPPGVEDFDFDDEPQQQQPGYGPDPYSFDALDRAVQSIDRSQRQQQRQGGRHGQQPGQSSNLQSHPNPNLHSRKQKEKERKRERMRSRAHKSQREYTGGGYMSSDDDGIGGLNDSDVDTDTEEANKENRWASNDFDDARNYNDKEIRGRRRDVHPTHPFPGESSQHSQQQQQYQWDSNASANNNLHPPSTSALRIQSPNPNVNGSNSGMPSHRQPALDSGANRPNQGISLRDPGPVPAARANPFIPPGAAGPSHHQQTHHASDRPVKNDPAYLAQLQFEAQAREYHGEKEKEERRARREREMGFYEGAVNTRRSGRESAALAGGERDGRGRDPNANANVTSWHGMEVRPRPNNRLEPGQRTAWHNGDLGREDLNPYGRRREEERGNQRTSYRNGWMDG